MSIGSGSVMVRSGTVLICAHDDEGPRVFVRVGFQGGSDIDGLETLCQLDCGVGAISWQGAYMNPGV